MNCTKRFNALIGMGNRLVSVIFLWNILLVLPSGTEKLFSQSIRGFQPDYETALAKAKKEQKVLMIDFYTDWCKPCKKLDKEIYSSEEFYPYTNEISCVKVDFETEQGGTLGKKYDVSSFPTILFVDTEGNEIERLTGYFPKKRYLKELERIIDGKNTVVKMEERYSNESSYTDLFHLSMYYNLRYHQPEKLNKYYTHLQKLDPQFEKDSTVMATNLIYQRQLSYNELDNRENAMAFVIAHPFQPYQPELAIRISKSYVEEKKHTEAYSFFKRFNEATSKENKAVGKSHLRELEKLIKK